MFAKAYIAMRKAADKNAPPTKTPPTAHKPVNSSSQGITIATKIPSRGPVSSKSYTLDRKQYGCRILIRPSQSRRQPSPTRRITRSQ